MPKFATSHDLKYTFIVSRVAEGNFKNLWKLEIKTPTDNDFVEIVDADMLSTIIAKIGFVFEQDGL